MNNSNPKLQSAKTFALDRIKHNIGEADKELTRKQAAIRLTKRVGLAIKSSGVGAARATVREGKETLIAKDIAGKGIRGKKLSGGEKKFLKSQSKDLVRSAAVVGTNVIPIPAPFFKAYLGAAYFARKKGIELMPSKQRIPKGYGGRYKTPKVDKYLNKQDSKIAKARKKLDDMRRSDSGKTAFNRNYSDDMTEEEKEIVRKFLENDYSEKKADLRELNINILARRKAQIGDKVSTVALAGVGAVAGGALSSIAVRLLYKKLRAKIAYLESKGMLQTPEQKAQLIRLKRKYKLINWGSIMVGAVAGGTILPKAIIPGIRKKNMTEIYKTER